MISLLPWREPGSTLRVLCLGAHCDDIEIGCGGTLLKLQESEGGADVRWLVLSSDAERARETRASAARFLGEGSEARVFFERFRDGFLPYEGGAVKETMERWRREFEPDVIFTHYRHDLHQDHRLVSELTWNTYRDHLVLEYEVPKWDGDLGRPNLYVHLEARHVESKLRILIDAYGSQRDRAWFDADAFRGLMRVRGVESRAPEGHAEAFYARKLVLVPGGQP